MAFCETFAVPVNVGVRVQICQGLDPATRRSGGNGAALPESVQRTALRAVCTIIDAFHFVGPGGRLRAAAVPQPAAEAAAQQRLRQASGLAPPGQAAVLLAAAPAPRAPGEPNSSAAGRAAGEPAGTGVVRCARSTADGGEEPDADGELLPDTEGGDNEVGDAEEPAAADGEETADQEGDQEEEGVEGLQEAEAAADGAAEGGADTGAGLEGRIQKVLVGRVLPALLRMMHKVPAAPALACHARSR